MTQITGLAVMIGRYSFESQHGVPVGILRMLAVLISTTKATTQLRNTHGKWTEENKNMYFIVILRAILHKEDIEKELYKFGQIQLDLIQAENRLTKNQWYLRKVSFLAKDIKNM